KIIRAIEEHLIPQTNKRVHPLLGAPSINVAAVFGRAKYEEDILRGRGDTRKQPGAVVPDTCRIYLDRRRIPGETLEQVMGDFQQLIGSLKEADPELDAQVRFVDASEALPTHPPLETDATHPLVTHCLTWTREITDRPVQPTGVPYWTDGAIFNALGNIPTVVFGPGNIKVAHSPYEHVPVDELFKAARIYGLTAASLILE